MLRSVGWGYVLVVVPILLFIFGFRAMELLIHSDSWAGGLLLALPVLSIHMGRKDHHFLRQIAPYNHRGILFFLEYLLLFLPFWGTLIFLGRGDVAGIFGLATLLIALVDMAWMPAVKWRALPLRWIPLRAFEWRAGMRKTGILILFFLIIGLIASHWVWAIPGTLIICALFIASFYQDLESKEMVEGPFQISTLLWQKIGLHSLLFHSIFALSYLVYFIRHGDLWWILVLSMVAVELLLSFSILVKYANWLPNREKHNAQTMIAVFAMGLLIPYLAPASLLLWAYYFRKASKRIEYFYYVKN